MFTRKRGQVGGRRSARKAAAARPEGGGPSGRVAQLLVSGCASRSGVLLRYYERGKSGRRASGGCPRQAVPLYRLISEVPDQRRGNGAARPVPRLAFGKPRHD